MRQKAYPNPPSPYQRLILYAPSENSVFLFLSKTREDSEFVHHERLESVAAARAAAFERYGVGEADWIPIPDPLPGAQPDLEQPTVVLRDAHGNPVQPPTTMTYEEAQQRGLVPTLESIERALGSPMLLMAMQQLVLFGDLRQAERFYQRKTGGTDYQAKLAVQLIDYLQKQHSSE